MIMIVCLLALMVYFDVRFTRVKNKWILFLFFTALFLKWKEEGSLGVLYGLLRFLMILMILLPVFACRILGAADVKIFLALSVYLSFTEMMFLMICSLVIGGLLGLIFLFFPTKYRLSVFLTIVDVKEHTKSQVVHMGSGIPNLKFHYIHFTIPIFLSFMITAYGGFYELLLCYLR